MRNQHQGTAQRPIQGKHLCNHFLPGGKVEAAGRLIGQQQGGLHHECPCQCHALLLTPRKNFGVMP